MKKVVFPLAAIGLLSGCAQPLQHPPIIPSLEYANRVRAAGDSGAATIAPMRQVAFGADGKARLQFANDDANSAQEPQFADEAMRNAPQRDYPGALSLGDPGVSASLWRESRDSNDIYRDGRAWRPMDLLTIVISERSEGTKEADTETKSESTVEASIENLLGLDEKIQNIHPNVDLSSLIKASTTNDFKGEGGTSRKGTLKATISAMVVEVLPSGILRIEGQKIIAVNNEEQVLVLTGLARPRDIDSANQVDSSKIADMRIDYYGRGTVGEAQYGGWLGRAMRILWPF